MSLSFTYKAIQMRQSESSRTLTAFAAKATEIVQWAGIPQKKRFGTGEETAGFQREYNPARVTSLSSFYHDKDNIIQNPLLCAIRDLPIASASFAPAPGNSLDDPLCHGTVTISIPDYDSMSLTDVIGHVRAALERRVPEVAGRAPDETTINALKLRAAASGHIQRAGDDATYPEGSEAPESSEGEEEESAEATTSRPTEDPATSALFEESHIVDFWQEVAARHELLKQIGNYSHEDFLDFTKDAMLAYLRPIVLVDGQHRLQGAISAARTFVETDEATRRYSESEVMRGISAADLTRRLVDAHCRMLPVSLLMSDDPAEQVFQFVVVNQKAMPIGRALLGTIVSTSLSNDEINKVATRLKDAGIPLEESQAITYLVRHPDSPFAGLVERGMTDDASDLLQWSVFASLIRIMRELKGGTLYHGRSDFAQLWRDSCLDGSQIVSTYSEKQFNSPYEYWRSLNGPWRDVFIAFWKAVRDKFGNTDRPESDGYWGKPRSSNLFNKVSLTILQSDFFHFLNDRAITLDSADSVSSLVNQWSDKVKPGYFDRSWELDRMGTKKDSPGIRKQWSYLWNDYRQSGGNLPSKSLYRQTRP
jgi:hypothetical protein